MLGCTKAAAVRTVALIGTVTLGRPSCADIETTYVDDLHWTYRCLYMPDNDQRRDLLLNEGRTYCVPTSVYNALGYIAAHGYPEIWPGDRFYTWWLNPANYDSATGQIGLLGTIMGTNPWDGGTTGDGEMAGLVSMLDTGDFIVGRVSPSGGHFPRLENMAAYAGLKPVVLLTIGWYTDEGVSTRVGGHKVTLDEVILDGGLRLIGFRDPGTDEDGDTIDLEAQSMYSSSRYNVVNEDRLVLQGGVVLNHSVERIVGITSGDRVGLLDGYTYILPARGFTMDPDFTEFIVHQPRAFDWDASWQPERRITVDLGDVVHGIVLNPATLDPYVLATDTDTGASVLWRIDPQTGDQQPRATFSGPFGMDMGRHRRIYVLDSFGLSLHCINIDGDHAVEEAVLTLPESTKAVVYDDATDQLYLPAAASTAIYMVDARTLTVADVSHRPAGTSIVGRMSAAVSPTDGRLWLATELSSQLLGLQLVPGGVADLIVVPHGLSRPKGIQVDDLNRVYLHDAGAVHAYRDLGGTEGWAEIMDTPFAGVTAAGGLCIARSRTDIEPWMTGPDWGDVLPTEVIEGTRDCLADITGVGDRPDGAVNVADLLYLLSAWGTTDPRADVAPNGLVDIGDLLQILSAWGACG